MTEPEVPDPPRVDARYAPIDYPKIGLPNGPVNIEGRDYLTKYLGTVILTLLHAKIEAADFERSECWDDMTDCQKPFGVEDFMSMLRYTSSMAISVFRDFGLQPVPYQNAEAFLQPANVLASEAYTGNTMRGMATMMMDLANQLNRVALALTKKIWASKGGVPAEVEDMLAVPADKIPAIDLRCLRLWCVLNTKKKRQEFENPKNTDDDMIKLIEGLKHVVDPSWEVPGVGFKPTQARKLRKVTEGKDNSLDFIVPMIIHICIGMGKVKGKPFHVIHDSTSIGSTRDRISGMPHYCSMRLNARNRIVGDVDISKWRKAFEELREFDEVEKGIEVSDERLRDLMTDGKYTPLKITCKEDAVQMMGRAYLANQAIGVPDLREPLPPAKLQALDIWESKPIRDCSKHIGRPFSTAINTQPAGCCWMCKVVIRYKEPTGTTVLHDGLNRSASKKDFFRDRNETPHSCAEVICSRYCIILEDDKKRRDTAEKMKREEEQRRRMAYQQSRARYSHVARR
ncbi:hypothetical protein J7337_010016 [Fusarium musae]|uniref:Uncharacterized protein n=1 Tax=Fusarium musae TaxID=1042133 RepID=A0A9P8DCF0_9HYPO|nr:hypothetical protein J7337_010016 [Fusarium musae]KAG9499197.1 hypothetical protein J7337_010016 [Fusarium musae]